MEKNTTTARKSGNFADYIIAALIALFLAIILDIAIYYIDVVLGGESASWIYQITHHYSFAIKTVILYISAMVFSFAVIHMREVKREIDVYKGDLDALQKSNKSKTEFVSYVTHQLRSPLTNMRNTLAMLSDGSFGPVNDEQQHYTKLGLQEVDRMHEIIENYLLMSKMDLHEMNVNLVMTPGKEVVTFVREMAEGYMIKSRDLGLVFESRIASLPTDVVVHIDAYVLKELIDILMENAFRYSNNYGKVVLSLSKSEEALVIAVKDDGIGIPDDQKEKIFTKYYRADNAKEKNSKGTGVGLYLAKELSSKLKGSIWFDSKQNEGTTFYVSIPTKSRAEEVLENI